MRRNIRSLLKTVLLAFLTVICTVVLFRLFRGAKQIEYAQKHKDTVIFTPATNEKIDWHNYELIEKDVERSGIGEQGQPAHLTASDSDKYDDLYKCSEQISASFIEGSDTGIDDCSTKEFSRKPLDDYLAANLTKVRTIHLPERSGLIRARLAGAHIATGEVLIFLDSHTEANVNWLPPLLEPIAQNYKTCVCPFIDVIQYETFEYRAQDEGARGAFDWELFYKRLPLLPEDLKHPTEPFKSPVMAGGLFAISQKFFWELGGYDEGLDIWGGEQYELSFKIWMCGGQMYDAPCSRVGHIYRKFAPFPNPGKGDFVGRNYKRVAEVWMDEYAEFIYKRRPKYRSIDPGDLSIGLGIRERLKCKSFKWFMETIAFDLPLKYPPIEPDDFAYGEIRNLAAPEFCVDTEFKERDQEFGLQECIKDNKKKGEQNFTLTWHKDIRPHGRGMLGCLRLQG
ncbi:n-acetylgalactosaminyltransferase [Holotrichia oblita]|uniref:N-acetylgalactosaminyltransferase n=1 Tax=Holotrichia oblita TaxID=644536 RepID=A0ACB9T6M0_HOLOL|nr:n-acetylgalactosaminyltransferase [Holotrichia oblita]